jgi:hypothetical protein
VISTRIQMVRAFNHYKQAGLVREVTIEAVDRAPGIPIAYAQ